MENVERGSKTEMIKFLNSLTENRLTRRATDVHKRWNRSTVGGPNVHREENLMSAVRSHSRPAQLSEIQQRVGTWTSVDHPNSVINRELGAWAVD